MRRGAPAATRSSSCPACWRWIHPIRLTVFVNRDAPAALAERALGERGPMGAPADEVLEPHASARPGVRAALRRRPPAARRGPQPGERWAAAHRRRQEGRDAPRPDLAAPTRSLGNAGGRPDDGCAHADLRAHGRSGDHDLGLRPRRHREQLRARAGEGGRDAARRADSGEAAAAALGRCRSGRPLRRAEASLQEPRQPDPCDRAASGGATDARPPRRADGARSRAPRARRPARRHRPSEIPSLGLRRGAGDALRGGHVLRPPVADRGVRPTRA